MRTTSRDPAPDRPDYIALPATAAAGAVLVLHSWWGAGPFFRQLADRLASRGFAALVPDLFDGRTARTVEEAQELRASATARRREPAYRYLIRGIGELQDRSRVQEIAVIGFSMGGHWACWLAQQAALPIAATVLFYAARGGDYGRSRSAFMAHFAAEDEWVSGSGVRVMERALARAARPYLRHDYPQTRHWFFEADRPEYREEPAAAAWERTLHFLESNTGSRGEE